MTQETNDNEKIEPEFITRIYNCPKCRIMHNIKIPKNLIENKPMFPFPYVYLHSSENTLEDILTILYLDSDLQIRAVEVVEVENSNIFSEQLTKQIAEKLMDKITSLEQENLQLQELLSKLDIGKLSEIQCENPKILSISNIKCPEIEEESPAEEQSIENEFLEEEQSLDNEFLEEEQLFDNESQIESPKEISSKKPEFNEEDFEFSEIKSKKPEVKTKTPLKSKTPAPTTPRGKKISVFLLSTIGPGEKRQQITVDDSNTVSDLKETIGNIFGLFSESFHLSSGGITFDEDQYLRDYNLSDGDEILIIPSSTAGL